MNDVSRAGGREDGCPLCDKPVMGRTALLGHLEFGHDIADPEAYLAQLEAPASSKRTRPSGRRAATIVGGIVLAAVLAAGGLVAFQQLSGDDAEVASGATATSTTAPDATTASSTTAPATSAPATTAPASSTTAPSTTAAPSTTVAPAEQDVPFRAPFLLHAEATGCTRQGATDVHEFRFEFSGALNITFDGVFYPDDTGDGVRTSTHELPAGASTYLDEVVVLDPRGDEHAVEITPPLYLGGC